MKRPSLEDVHAETTRVVAALRKWKRSRERYIRKAEAMLTSLRRKADSDTLQQIADVQAVIDLLKAIKRVKPPPQDLTLLEFIGWCFEKNEMFKGKLLRSCVYRTTKQAEQQATTLILQGTALLGIPKDYTTVEGIRRATWPTLQILLRGRAVLIAIPLRQRAYRAWELPAKTWERAGDDLSALYRAVAAPSSFGPRASTAATT